MPHRRLLLPLALSFLLLLASAPLRAADPLDKPVLLTYSARNFREVVSSIQAGTGFAVQCPKDVADFLAARVFRGWSYPYNPGSTPSRPARDFLNDICRDAALSWTFDPATNTVTLDHQWHRSDPRSAREILAKIKERSAFGKPPADSLPDILALIGNPENVALGWRPLQISCLQVVFHWPERLKPLLVGSVTTADLTPATLILLKNSIDMYPGHGNACYFLFREDGTLTLAGVMNTGWRCELTAALVANPPGYRSPDEPSKIQMVLKRNLRDFLIAHFRLEKNGLQLTSVIDSEGQPVNTDGNNIGNSLLPK
ncbi:hypothetical protein DB345_02455 [Spartobacteria bacterium LR76]|nr:hypothetical protein DB345_02455 [Spartobacteria bacterium LR76]